MSKTVSVNFPIMSILGVLFIGLKLTNYIDWAWIWVLLPLWFPLGIWAAVAAIGLLIVLIGACVEHLQSKKRIKARRAEIEARNNGRR